MNTPCISVNPIKDANFGAGMVLIWNWNDEECGQLLIKKQFVGKYVSEVRTLSGHFFWDIGMKEYQSYVVETP